MKTLHMHRPAAAAAPSAAAARATRQARPTRPTVLTSTMRLGIVVSAVAAVVAIVLDAVLDVPALLILVPVVVVGFALSWHASGRPHEPHPEE